MSVLCILDYFLDHLDMFHTPVHSPEERLLGCLIDVVVLPHVLGHPLRLHLVVDLSHCWSERNHPEHGRILGVPILVRKDNQT